MKTLTLILAALLLCYSGFSQNSRPAGELFQEALAKAKKENKNVFVIFTATWCGPCKYLKRAIYDEENVGFFEKNYVIVELYGKETLNKKNLENPGADSLLAAYNGDSTAVPYWMIINAAGKKLHGEMGIADHAETLVEFGKTIKKTSRLDDFEIKMIVDRFKQVARLTPAD